MKQHSKDQPTTTAASSASSLASRPRGGSSRKRGDDNIGDGGRPRDNSVNLDSKIKQFSLNFSDRQFEAQFRSTSDITSCVSLVGLPITLICAFFAYVHLHKV
jgi:hypothetical protein